MRKPQGVTSGKPQPAITRLKLLPYDKRELIWERRDLPLPELRAWVARTFDIEVAWDSRMSEFLAWHYRQRLLERSNSVAEQIAAFARKARPNIAPEELRQFQLQMLAASAEERGDHKFSLAVLKEQGKDIDRSTARRRLEIAHCEKFLEWFKDKKARDIAESHLSNADKIAALRQAYFADVDALEASGKVELPE